MDLTEHQRRALDDLDEYDQGQKRIAYLDGVCDQLRAQMAALPSSLPQDTVRVQGSRGTSDSKLIAILDQISQAEQERSRLSTDLEHTLDRIVSSMTETEAALIKLRHKWGLSFDAIGKTLYMSRSQVHRAYWEALELYGQR